MKNQPRAAAQTASIGNQDMMTFMPGPVPADGGVAGGGNGAVDAPSQQMGSLPPVTAMAPAPDTTAGGNSCGGMIPDPLRGQHATASDFGRGESMDDEAFNASLDALLKEAAGDDVDDDGAPCYGGPHTGMMDVPVVNNAGMSHQAMAAMGAGADLASNSVANNAAGRKRKICGSPARGALVTEMSSLTNSSDSVTPSAAVGMPGSGGDQQQQQQQQQPSSMQQHQLHHHHPPSQLNFSARSIVQLPPMFASQPISVSAGPPAPTGMMTLPGGADLFGGAQVLGAAAAQVQQAQHHQVQLGQQHQQAVAQQAQAQVAAAAQHQQQQQQLPFQVASMGIPPQHLQLSGGTSATSSGVASLMSQIGIQPPQAQAQQTNELFPAFQLGSNNPWDAFQQSQAARAVVAASSSGSTPQAQASVSALSAPSLQQASALAPAVPIAVGSATNPPTKKSRAVAVAAAATSSVAATSYYSSSAAGTSATSNNKTKQQALAPVASASSSSAQGVVVDRKRARSGTTATTNGSSTLAVSEDESEKKKRRNERNLREQERSHRITQRIEELRGVLKEAGVLFKEDRYSTLVSVVNYIKALQSRSASLDEEHRKLLDTISGADKLVNSSHNENGHGAGGAAVGGGMGMTTTVHQTHPVKENTTGTSSGNSSSSGRSCSNDEEFLVFVQGIDYKSIFASCGVALAIASVDGRFVDCNEEFLRITNYSRSELLGEEPRRNTLLPHPQGGSSSPPAGGVGQGVGGLGQGPVVTISTSTSANSSALTTAAAVVAASKPPDQHASHSGGRHGSSPSKDRGPPHEIHISKQHLSLFNLLGGEDMETVYTAMSRMLRAPELPTSNAGTSSASSATMLCLSSKNGPTDDSGGASSSSTDSFVKSDLTRSTEESSSGNEVSNEGDGSAGADGGEGAGGSSSSISRYTVDHWAGRVKHTRRKNQMLQLNISLVRTADGRPKFFNCAISEVE